MAFDALDPERCAELLAALASPERLRIVRLLGGGERNVSQITGELDIPPLNVNHHLKVLKHAKLVEDRKEGRFVIYSLRDGIWREIREAGNSKAAIDLGCCELLLGAVGG